MRVQIINTVDRDFGMVPRALWQMSELTFAAKACAAYLFCLRDGALPYVAEMEQAIGLGRDARRKAFAQLERLGIIEWKVVRIEGGKVVGKVLQIDPLACRGPENQAVGEINRPPEKPSDGESVGTSTEIRPYTDCGSVALKRKEKKDRAAQARRQAVQAAGVGKRSDGRPNAIAVKADLFAAWQASPGKLGVDKLPFKEWKANLHRNGGIAENNKGGVACRG